MAADGMVATSYPAAVAGGGRRAARGGNAVDAALAASGMLSLVEPHVTGVGFDSFLLYTPAGGALVALNGSSRALRRAELAWYRDKGFASVPEQSPHAVPQCRARSTLGAGFRRALPPARSSSCSYPPLCALRAKATFGSAFTAPRIGVLLHCRGTSLRLFHAHPNAIGPHKPPLHTIIPAMLRRGERAVMPFGVVGATTRPRATLIFWAKCLSGSRPGGRCKATAVVCLRPDSVPGAGNPRVGGRDAAHPGIHGGTPALAYRRCAGHLDVQRARCADRRLGPAQKRVCPRLLTRIPSRRMHAPHPQLEAAPWQR